MAQYKARVERFQSVRTGWAVGCCQPVADPKCECLHVQKQHFAMNLYPKSLTAACPTSPSCQVFVPAPSSVLRTCPPFISSHPKSCKSTVGFAAGGCRGAAVHGMELRKIGIECWTMSALQSELRLRQKIIDLIQPLEARSPPCPAAICSLSWLRPCLCSLCCAALWRRRTRQISSDEMIHGGGGGCARHVLAGTTGSRK